MIRVWYMFTHSSIIRMIAVVAFVTNTLATTLLSGFLWSSVRAAMPQNGLNAVRTPVIAWLYVPSLLFHSLLFALKVYRFVMSPKNIKRDSFLWLFLKE